MLTFLDIFQAFQLAVLGFVFSCVLMAQGKLLEPWLDFLTDFKKANRVARWLSNPLGLCEACFTGQLALWVWLAQNWEKLEISTFAALLEWALFISFSILFVVFIKEIYSKCKN